MRNLQEIEALLDKYWLGETTLEEERALKAYFGSATLPESLQPLAPLFQALRQEQALHLKRDKFVPMAATTSSRIRRWAAAASVAALLTLGAWWLTQLPVPPESVADHSIIPVLPIPAPSELVRPPVQAPAVAVVEQPKTVRKTAPAHKKPATVVPDAETVQAMEEIKAALALLSSKLNKGSKAAVKDLNHLETMDRFLKPKSES